MQIIFTEFPELTSTNNTWVLAILLRSEHLNEHIFAPSWPRRIVPTAFVNNAQYPACLEARLYPNHFFLAFTYFICVVSSRYEGKNVTKWATSPTIFVNEFWNATIIGCRNMLNIIPLFVTNNRQAPVFFHFLWFDDICDGETFI